MRWRKAGYRRPVEPAPERPSVTASHRPSTRPATTCSGGWRWPAALLLAVVASVPPAIAQAQTGISAPVPLLQNVLSFSVTATAEAPNDWLSISFSTTREAADAAQVQQQLKQALDAALVEARKVARPGQVEVRTGGFALSPRYGSKGTMTGWQGSAQLVVEGRDMAAISALSGRIQTLSIAGVRQSLSREAREQLETEVTGQAIARFRARAKAQAEQFGFTGFTLREVQVGSDAPPPAPMVAMRARVAAAAPEEALPLEAGKALVTATVNGSVQLTR